MKKRAVIVSLFFFLAGCEYSCKTQHSGWCDEDDTSKRWCAYHFDQADEEERQRRRPR